MNYMHVKHVNSETLFRLQTLSKVNKPGLNKRLKSLTALHLNFTSNILKCSVQLCTNCISKMRDDDL